MACLKSAKESNLRRNTIQKYADLRLQYKFRSTSTNEGPDDL